MIDRAPVTISHAAILGMLAFVSIATLLFFVAPLSSSPRMEVGVPVIVTFAINGLMALLMLLDEARMRAFSLQMVHWIFFLVFLVVAPVSQYWHNYCPWSYYLEDDVYVTANLALLVWGILFIIGSRLGFRKEITASEKHSEDILARMPSLTSSATFIVLAFSVAIAIYVLVAMGPEQIFSRKGFSFGIDGSLGVVADRFLRAVPVYAVVLLGVRARRAYIGKLSIALSIIALLVVDFPTSMARYRAATVYGGLLLLLWRPLRQRKMLFLLVMLLGLLIVFPALSSFRFSSFGFGLLFSSVVQAVLNLSNGFCSGDFDAYSMFARSIIYVKEAGVSGGYQLLGVLLFFIPRGLWPSKPIGTGAMIGEFQGQQFLNIACPLPGEMYVNFGFLGFAVSAVLISRFLSLLDNRFIASNSLYALFYPFLCMMLFFIMRGDLLSSFAYLIGFYVPFIITIFCAKRLSYAQRAREQAKSHLSKTVECRGSFKLESRSKSGKCL